MRSAIIGILLGTTVITAALMSRAAEESKEAAKEAATKPLQLDGGAASIDSLLDQFLQALAANDERALNRLRVSEREYRDIIVPGTAKPGEPPREVPQNTADFFWSMLNQKSEDTGRHIMQNLGGHTYKRGELTYTKGTREFVWYKAHGDVRLKLENEKGETKELRTGTIAEVGGRFKFIGFNTNN